ncbi:hypothetical protein [Pseudogemmobacter sonorensis]|uniref:hypothetical protein n=1 Tax=Pseudogemmobacter sonorensis TaxID=2989681 RepID=UPI003681DF58
MMKRLSIPHAMATAAVVALCTPALAQEEDRSGANRGQVDEAVTGPAAKIALAHDLYAIGTAEEDALAVATAARLLASVAEEDGAEAPRSETRALETGAPEGAVADPSEGSVATSDEMFAKAVELAQAGEDPALAELIVDLAAEGNRGSVHYVKSWGSSLSPGWYEEFYITFHGQEFAEVAIIGEGRSVLDLTVYDENGNVICTDYRDWDQAYCSWTPKWTGEFTVVVSNEGYYSNNFVVVTN